MRPFLKRVPPATRTENIRLANEVLISDENVKMLVFLTDMIIAMSEKQEERDFMLQVDEIQHLIETEPAVEQMMTTWTLQQLANVSILSECIHELDMAYQYKMPDHAEEIHADFIKTADEFIEDGDIKILDSRTLQRAMPTTNSTKFLYPVNKRHTRENVEQMRLAEENLDAMWKAMDHELSRYPVFTPRVRDLLATRRKQRTLPWDEVRDGKSQARVAVEEYQPMSEIHFELQSRTERTIDKHRVVQRKVKEKTKGATAPSTADAAVEAPTSQSEELAFFVDKRALKVFRTIFFVPSTSSLPGEVAWADFCHAMTSTGFQAEKLRGSVWQFTPTNLDVENPISIHEPHPSGKIPFVHARRHGRRLARHYGWHIGLFKLKETA